MNRHAHAIVLLPAGVKKNSEGKWVSTDFSEEDDKHGAPGGKLRVHAAAHLHKKHERALLITGGGLGYDVKSEAEEDRPLLADILLDELLELDVEQGRVILERNSNSTYQELVEVERIMHEYGISELTFVSSRYALPRLKAMIEVKFSHLKNHVKLSFVHAEDILVEADPDTWADHIRAAYESEYLKQRIVKESSGIEEMMNGVYVFK